MRFLKFIFSLLLGACLCSDAAAQTLIPLKAAWRYFKGTAEPSATGVWRDKTFSDSGWALGAAPFYYGETFSSGTVLSDMRSNYTTVYLRKTFDVVNPAAYDRLIIRTLIDDGWIIWINNKEVPRFNVGSGERAFNTTATANIEQTWVTNSVVAADYLEAGPNVIAVQVFNSTRTSTDIVFDLQMDGATDRVAPTISSVSPPAGAVQELRSITVNFSEPVQGINATDFLVNNSPASSVAGSGGSYTFSFAQPAYGIVNINWEAGHQIGDFGIPPNPFDSTASSARWQYTLGDTIAPTVLTVNPPSGSTVRTLSQVDVRFSEAVAGIDAGDLIINGSPAMSVTTNGNLYTFKFPAQPTGPVVVNWSACASHGITDFAVPENSFSPQSFSYTVDPNYVAPTVIISEFLAAQSDLGRKDEDGEAQDWIEIFNTTSSPVNLAGWSLTDDPEESDLWLFPNITIGAGARLVVYASGKDRRPTSGNLHTNFKLNAGGEFLGLYNAESPRLAMTAIHFPEQRNDFSYGLDSSGFWQYFQTPTPGAANGTTTIVGLIPKLKATVKHGTFDAAFDLDITNEVPGIAIRYTTDGSEPTQANGLTLAGPMRISTTTVIRAVGFRANYVPSGTLTESYIFLDQVIAQGNSPANFPVGPTAFGGYPADYEMDPEIINSTEYQTLMKTALQALPIISIAIRPYDLFDTSNGIYNHPLSRGTAWERACSIEFFTQDGKGFQENAGIQIQGNAAREPIKTPKHPMRVVFKGDYGPSKLNFKMFPDSPLDTFDTLILRADFNNSWLHWDPTQRQRGQRIRDAWMKDSMRAMGGLASHNRFAHLFLNGVYWGIYEPTERPDGSFGEGYLGGQKEDYDVINEGAAVDGTMTAYNQMLAITNLADINQYNSMKTYLDMTQFIDYMLLHFYVGHTDWFLNKNWYAVRPKNGSSGFKYVPWDGELVLGDLGTDRVNTSDLPSGLHPKLLASPEYKLAFADRVQKHFFNGGALMPAQNAARYAKRTKEIETAIIAESARWGDYRRDVHQYQSAPYELYTRNVQWRNEQARLTNTYFPGRTATVLGQLRNAGLFPAFNAPVFSQNGGQITQPIQLTMTGTSTIYYTTNGADPRVYGTSAVSPDAFAYAGPIQINSTVTVKARSLSGTTWSALNEAVFSNESPRIPLRFTEIMYNPDPAGDAYEYLELQNIGAHVLDVSGFFITGIDYIFPPQTILAPGQIVLLGSAANINNFKTRYPGVTTFGTFNGQLQNSGERIAVVRPDGRTVTSVTYDDEGGWAPEADGLGYSLQVIDPFSEANDPANWRASSQLKGTAGAANPVRPGPQVVINEIYATSDNLTDFLELRSTTNSDLNIGGWVVWKVGNSNKFTFPLDTILPAQTYLILHCDRLTNEPGFHANFALDRDGETYILNNGRSQRIDARTIGNQARPYSSGFVNNQWNLTTPTPGAENIAVADFAPSTGLVINEWLSNPVPGDDDWLEVHNTHPTFVADLRGLFFGVTNELFEISRPYFVEPGGYIRIWADNDELDFKLPAEGSTLRIVSPTGTNLHEVTYTPQVESISTGRYPNGKSSILDLSFPTPGEENNLSFPITLTTTAATLKISWPSTIGVIYQVQSTSDLSVPNSWANIQQVTANSSTPAFETSIEPSATRFFRIARQP